MANLNNFSTDERLILMGQATREASLKLIVDLTGKPIDFVAILVSQAASYYMDKTDPELSKIIEAERLENDRAYKAAFKPNEK